MVLAPGRISGECKEESAGRALITKLSTLIIRTFRKGKVHQLKDLIKLGDIFLATFMIINAQIYMSY